MSNGINKIGALLILSVIVFSSLVALGFLQTFVGIDNPLQSQGAGSNSLNNIKLVGKNDPNLMTSSTSETTESNPYSGNLHGNDSSGTYTSTTFITLTTTEFYTCTYRIFVNQSYYYAEDCLTFSIDFGGQSNIGGVNGSDASSVIQAALDALPSNGGSVDLFAGTYVLTSMLTIPSNTVLSGIGVNSTILLASSNLVSSVIQNSGGSVNPNRNSEIQDLSIDGIHDTRSNVNGITWYSDSSEAAGSGTYSLLISNVVVEYMSGNGMNLEAGPKGNGWYFVENSRVFQNIGIGLYLVAPDSTVENVYGSGSYTGPVVFLSGGTDTFIGGYFGGSGYMAQVELDNALGTTFLGTIIDSSNGYGLYVTGTYSSPTRNITYVGGEISDSGISADNVYSSVDFAGATNGFIFLGTKFWQASSNANKPEALVFTTSGVTGVVFQNCIIQTDTYDRGVTVPSNLSPNSVLFVNDTGFNPVGMITNPFGISTIGLGGVASQISPISSYSVSGVDLTAFICTGGSGVSISEVDSKGNTIQTFTSPFTMVDVPAGYQIITNSWTTAPTCSAYGD